MDFDIEMEDAAGQYPGEVEAAAYDDNALLPQEDILPIDVDEIQEPGEIDEAAEAATAAAMAAAAADAAETTVVPTKVHLRGLDAFTPDDLKAYVAETTGAGGTPFERVEWIDDSSANLVFASESAAAAALAALAALAIDDPAQLPPRELLPAKPFAGKPDATALQVRFAVAADKKQAGAAARSRFYLLHPEYDPEERRRSSSNRGGRGRDDGDRDRRPRYRSYRDDRGDRDADIRNNAFDVNLYDDAPPAARAKRSVHRGSSSRSRSRSRSRTRVRPRSRSRSSSRARFRRRNQNKELFPSSGRRELFPDATDATGGGGGGGGSRAGVDSGDDRPLRDRVRNRDRTGHGRLVRTRSASPRRESDAALNGHAAQGDDEDNDYDGRLADERAEAAAAAAARNRDKARAIKDRLAPSRNGGTVAEGSSRTRTNRSNGVKELFPSAGASTAQMDGLDSTAAVTTRLSGMSLSLDGTCELSRRQRARSSASMSNPPVLFMTRQTMHETRDCNTRRKAKHSLTATVRFFSPSADRISRPAPDGNNSSSNGDHPAGSAFFIRGLAGEKGSPHGGLSIKGVASARELFPDKLNGDAASGNGTSSGNNGRGGSGGDNRGRNAGKEIFDNRLANRIRPRPRQRAEDMFH
ncbi:hypothetical protein SPI_03192 [Niveomyces insectorum RCEF 264]|uniref:Nucleotide-binding, alpha-beta plait n=1 Tax=Niveomyces insectorum RCEF 264 TaxID=1081102 RepID=A0A167X599_9HYPO|nr:hypothetical protein SPI_03192 [Niveomyces insectorum RCEF 264]